MVGRAIDTAFLAGGRVQHLHEQHPQLAARLTMESLSLPAAQWPSLAEQTRTKYLQGFQEAISQLKAESKSK